MSGVIPISVICFLLKRGQIISQPKWNGYLIGITPLKMAIMCRNCGFKEAWINSDCEWLTFSSIFKDTHKRLENVFSNRA